MWQARPSRRAYFHINYLGADQLTFPLNFSKGASQVIAQYYQLIRLGYKGYKKIIENCRANAKNLHDSIIRIGHFNILSKEQSVPLVAFSLKEKLKYNENDISEHLRRFNWVVPTYTMAPDAQHVTLLRVVIQEDFGRSLADRLVQDISTVLNELESMELKGEKEKGAIVGATANGNGHNNRVLTRRNCCLA